MRVTQEGNPFCYLTANHGESFGDYELMRVIVEAGYTVGFLDLSSESIPEDCELLVTYNPKQDLIGADGVSSVSEIEKIDAFMAQGGKYMVFLSADTFASGEHKNLEVFLADWGVKYMHQPGDGVEECYLIKDQANSLTIDGYTVLSENASRGFGANVMEGFTAANVFGNSTCISFADGFSQDAEGNFVASVNGKTRKAAPLMVTHGTAEAWANGRAVARAANEPFVLMSMTVQDCENGEKAYLVASASTDFASESAMQSAVLGNGRTLTGIMRYMGKENAPVDLVFKPFGSTDIESLTTSTANLITVLLAVVPALICLVTGVVVLVRRRNA
jgi:ABC-2 type transport system permease protein